MPEPAKHKQNLYANDKVLISYKKTPAVREETAGAISLTVRGDLLLLLLVRCCIAALHVQKLNNSNLRGVMLPINLLAVAKWEQA